MSHFRISDQSVKWLRRALTHPSLRAAKRLPDCEDNRTTALFGGLIFQVGFSHYIAARYFSTPDFRLQDASVALISRNAVSADALGPIADRLGIMRHVSMGPQTCLEELNLNQRASFLESLTAVRFLDQAPHFDLSLALVPDVLAHFEHVVSGAKSVEDLKGPLTRLLEFAARQQIRAVSEEPIEIRPCPRSELVARIRFTSNIPHGVLVIRGGKGADGATARHCLANTLLPIFRSIHCDFAEARRRSSNELVDKLAALLIPAAFAAAPQSAEEAEKWRSLGLLGSGLLSEGNFTEFSLWAQEANRYIQQPGVSIQDLEERALGFYRWIGTRRGLDLRSAAETVVVAVKKFASSAEALLNIRSLRQQSFFVKMQELLRVLSLAAKPNGKQTTVREAFEGLELLRRRDDQIRWTFDGPELAVAEREGATIELCAEILDALSATNGQPLLEVAIRTAIQNRTATVIIRRTSDGIPSCRPSERLDGSLLISFLQAEGFIDSIRSDGNEVTCVLPQVQVIGFAQKAKIAVESPIGALDADTRSALSKLLHDLKNHLIAAEVAVATKTSNRTLALRAQAEASEHLDAACRLADQFASLAGVLGQATIAEVSAPDFFKRLCTRLFTTLPDSISLGVPGASGNASIWTSEQFIESIVDNLVRNSVDAMNGRGRLELDWATNEDSSIWVIKIRDTGPGIPQELLQCLVAGKSVTSSKPGGSGVGMLTVVSMLRRLGGQISGITPVNGGTEWTLRIPSRTPSELDNEPVPTEPSNLSTE